MRLRIAVVWAYVAAIAATYADAQEQELFGPGTEITELNAGGNAFSPALNEDETYMVFASTRVGGQGGYDLMEARRADINLPWTSIVHLPQLNSRADDYEPHISYDGLELYLATTRNPAGIYVARRANATTPWGAPTMAIPGALDDPFLTQDGLTMYYTGPGAGGGDIFTATRSQVGAQWQPRGALPGPVNSAATDHSPHPEGNGDILWFSSDRTGGAGSSDFYLTWRTGTTFAMPVNVTELNTSVWESNAWCGGCTGRWYMSRFIAGTPTPRIFLFCRRPIVTWIPKCIFVPIPKINPLIRPPIFWCRRWLWSIRVPVIRWYWYDWWPWNQLFGAISAAPIPRPPGFGLPGFHGRFLLDLTQPFLFPGPFPIPPNRLVSVQFQIPNNPVLIGLTLSMQTMGFDATGGGFSEVGQIQFTQ